MDMHFCTFLLNTLFTWYWQHTSCFVCRIWCKHEITDRSCLVSTVQAAAGGVMMWDVFSWHKLGPLPIDQLPTSIPQPSWVLLVSLSHPFMTTVDHLMAGSSRKTLHVAKIELIQLVFWTWYWDQCTQMASAVTRSQSNRAAIMDVLLTNLQELHDAVMSIRTKMSAEYFQHLVKFMPWRSEGKWLLSMWQSGLALFSCWGWHV